MSNVIQFPALKHMRTRDGIPPGVRRVTVTASYDLETGKVTMRRFVKVRSHDVYISNPLADVIAEWEAQRGRQKGEP